MKKIKKYGIIGFASILFVCLFITIVYHKPVHANNDNVQNSPILWWKRSPGSQVKTVVIDPGHGGKDPGCHGDFAHEKDICLAVSLKLGKLIEEHFPDVKVVYTRKTDIFVELYQRAKIANDAKADLFICIHVNAGGDGKAYGAETYVMGLHKTETNLNVAKRENSVIEFEDNYQKQYEGFDPNSAEGSILFSLYQNTYLKQSLSFADKVQKEFVNHAGRHDRGVRQAGFLVLVYTTMPAVLIETGFATNPSEEKFLASENGQTKMSESIFQAFYKYKKEIEGDKYAGMSKEYKSKDITVKTEKKDTTTKVVKDNNTNEVKGNNNGVVYKVQFLSSKKKLDTNSTTFSKIKKISYDFENEWYKYMSGEEKTLDDAKKVLSSLVDLGYKDAYIIQIKNGVKTRVK